MCLGVLLFLGAAVFLIWVLAGASTRPDGLRLRLPAAAGAGMILFSIISMPWVSFAPLDYPLNTIFKIEPGMIREYAPEALALIFRLVGQRGLARILSLITSVGFVPGWALIVVMPSRGILIRLTILLVGLLGIVGTLWFPLSIFVSWGGLKHTLSLVIAVASALALLLLLLQMPAIDAWGTERSFLPGLLALTVGSRMGMGVWVAWVGLLLLALGSTFDLLVVDEAR